MAYILYLLLLLQVSGDDLPLRWDMACSCRLKRRSIIDRIWLVVEDQLQLFGGDWHQGPH